MRTQSENLSNLGNEMSTLLLQTYLKRTLFVPCSEPVESNQRVCCSCYPQGTASVVAGVAGDWSPHLKRIKMTAKHVTCFLIFLPVIFSLYKHLLKRLTFPHFARHVTCFLIFLPVIFSLYKHLHKSLTFPHFARHVTCFLIFLPVIFSLYKHLLQRLTFPHFVVLSTIQDIR